MAGKPEKNQLLTFARIGAACVILVVMIIVVFHPDISYAPVPRVLLFCLAGMMFGMFLGAEATSRFEMRLPGFLFVTGGAAAVGIGVLFLLNYLAKPDIQIAVFSVVDESDNKVGLEWDGAIELEGSPLIANYFVKQHQVVLIFPEQHVKQVVRIRKSPSDKQYLGTVSYAGNRELVLKLGRDIKQP